MSENESGFTELNGNLSKIENIFACVNRNNITSVHGGLQSSSKNREQDCKELLSDSSSCVNSSELNPSSPVSPGILSVSWDTTTDKVSFVRALSSISYSNLENDGKDAIFTTSDTAMDSDGLAVTQKSLPISSESQQPGSEVDGGGFSIYPGMERDVKSLQSVFRLQIALSLVRNLACYIFIVCIVLVVEWDRLKDWWHIFILCVAAICFFGIFLQIVHVGRTLRGQTSNILLQTLQKAMHVVDFECFMNQLKLSAPYIGAEIKLSDGICNDCAFSRHCLGLEGSSPVVDGAVTSRTEFVIKYGHWRDSSQNIRDISNRYKPPFRIILSKNYRFADKSTKELVNVDVDEFKKQYKFNKYRFSYVLDVAEGETFSNVLLLVVPDKTPNGKKSFSFFSPITYSLFSCIALDFIYSLIYLALTRNAGVYYITKAIKRLE